MGGQPSQLYTIYQSPAESWSHMSLEGNEWERVSWVCHIVEGEQQLCSDGVVAAVQAKPGGPASHGLFQPEAEKNGLPSCVRASAYWSTADHAGKRWREPVFELRVSTHRTAQELEFGPHFSAIAACQQNNLSCYYKL